MKKVVYSVSRTNRYGSTKMTGLGFVTESDLIIACNGKSGKAYIRVFEDCVKNCHAVPNRPGEFKGTHYEIREVEFEKRLRAAKARDMRRESLKSNIPSGTSSWIEEAGL